MAVRARSRPPGTSPNQIMSLRQGQRQELANTSASTANAPTAPIIASVITPVPLPDAGLPANSSCWPVTETCHPAGAAALRARPIAGPRAAPPNPVTGAAARPVAGTRMAVRGTATGSARSRLLPGE